MGKKILLADDSITIQKVIELTFSDEDFEVTTVGNGRLAIEKAEEVRPDLVLCDIIMPEKDGYEVCDHVKKSPTLSGVPVLLLTGAFEPFDQERANKVGADGYLAKPFEPQALVSRVRELLESASRPATPVTVKPPEPPAAVAPAPEPPPPVPAPQPVPPAPPTSRIPVIPPGSGSPRRTVPPSKVPVVPAAGAARRPTFSGRMPVVPGRAGSARRPMTPTGRVPQVPPGLAGVPRAGTPMHPRTEEEPAPPGQPAGCCCP